jgi:hypothetical protein
MSGARRGPAGTVPEPTADTAEANKGLATRAIGSAAIDQLRLAVGREG